MVDAAFESMADVLARVADDLRAALHANGGRPAPDSPGALEAERNAFGGEWGNPVMALTGTLVLAANSCLDHLRAAAILIRSRVVTLSPHTAIRGAAEAAVLGAYLADPKADERERVRRAVNARLAGLGQERLALMKFAGSESEASATIAGIDQVLDRFERTALAHGFSFQPAKGNAPACLDAKMPGATELLGRYVFPPTEQLGRAYYSTLSSVAHSQINGLMRKLVTGGVGGPQVNATAADTALELLAGPLATSTLVEYAAPYLGWRTSALEESIPSLFELWGHIGGASYPGPVFGPATATR